MERTSHIGTFSLALRSVQRIFLNRNRIQTVMFEEADVDPASVLLPGNAPSGSHRPAVPYPTRAQLTARAKKQPEWDQRNAIVLMYMGSTLDITMSDYLHGGKTAAQIYQDLRLFCEAKSFYSMNNKAIKWATWKYKTGMKPVDFVTK
ncbi:hypothetical protein VN97_g1644 [Penicillium thymicola]|uniref:Uncharacterized protein n=1 Tax=Penicillium thymicola TaxID=293382 RepID=A0AAI9TR70_PENTH|nr:hypothetical protein VN97_g1644 [Penicillium thymicola]